MIFWFTYLHGDLVNESLLGRILLMILGLDMSFNFSIWQPTSWEVCQYRVGDLISQIESSIQSKELGNTHGADQIEGGNLGT